MSRPKFVGWLDKYQSKLPDFHKFQPDMKGWCYCDFRDADIYLPNMSALYVMKEGRNKSKYQYNKILYVGISTDVRNRFLNGHHRFYEALREGVKTIHYCPFPIGTSRRDMELVEAAYIHYFLPRLNQFYPVAFSDKDIIVQPV